MVVLFSLAVLLGCLLVVTRAQTSTSDLVTIPAPPITFFWQALANASAGFESDEVGRAIPQCSVLNILVTDNPNSPVATVPPLYIHQFPIGGQPSVEFAPAVVQDGTDNPEGFFQWTANLAVGTNLTLAMSDSAGNSGGSVDGYYIVEGSNDCTIVGSEITSPVSFTISPQSRPCSEIDLDISGGEKPYTISLLAGLSGLYANLTGVTSSNVKLANTVPAGQRFNFLITDANGATSNVSTRMTSAVNLSNCNLPNAEQAADDGISVGAIVGAVVGGVIGALLLALLAWWLLRRRSKKSAQRSEAQERATKGEFRMADGSAPLVTPFMMPQHSPDYSDETSPASAHPSMSKRPDFGGPYHTTITPIHTSVPAVHPAYSQTTASPTSPKYPSPAYPSEPSSAYDSFSPTQDSYQQQTAASSTVDGLANPEEFAYRDAGTWSGSNQPTLPPGAQRPMYD